MWRSGGGAVEQVPQVNLDAQSVKPERLLVARDTVEARLTQDIADLVQGLAQRAARPVLCHLAPKQANQTFAGLLAGLRQSQISKQRPRLTAERAHFAPADVKRQTSDDAKRQLRRAWPVVDLRFGPLPCRHAGPPEMQA